MLSSNIKKTVVIGAGVMGHSIAQVFAQNGVETCLVDLDQNRLDHAMELVKSNLETLAEFGKVSVNDIPAIINRIHPTPDLATGCKDADFAVEAINETIDAKKKIFSLLEKHCPPKAILASNSSSINIFDFVEIQDPGRSIVTHWFAPPHIIPLVEVVPGPKTSQETTEATANFLRKMGKLALVFKGLNGPSLVNRFQDLMTLPMWEAMEKGWATPAEIDLAVKAVMAIRLPIVGVAQRLDFTGMNLVLDITKSYGGTNPVAEELVKQGRLGVSSGKGFYDYGGRTEAEILRDRDIKYLKMLECLEKLDAFKPV
ncbi:MAG: 3-hydroxyacyl-CoA dehydrogenase family protein [Chloroflexi bacterium]|nr:3-hydroxyacyl-CoA dehydrogenase family protein [Chloroflexota bacterium]